MERATHPARAVVTIPRTSANRLTSRRGRQTRSSVGFGLAHDVGPEPEYAGAASVASGAASDRNSVNPGGVGTVRHAADPGLARMPRGRKTSLIPPGATSPESMIGSFTDRRVSNRDSAGVRHRERSGPPIKRIRKPDSLVSQAFLIYKSNLNYYEKYFLHTIIILNYLRLYY